MSDQEQAQTSDPVLPVMNGTAADESEHVGTVPFSTVSPYQTLQAVCDELRSAAEELEVNHPGIQCSLEEKITAAEELLNGWRPILDRGIVLMVPNYHTPDCGPPPWIVGGLDDTRCYRFYFENPHGEQFVMVYDTVSESCALFGGDWGWDSPVYLQEDGRFLDEEGKGRNLSMMEAGLIVSALRVCEHYKAVRAAERANAVTASVMEDEGESADPVEQPADPPTGEE